MSKQEKIASEQKEISTEQKGNASASKTSSYLKNTPTKVIATRYSSQVDNLQLLAPLLGEYPHKNMVTEQLYHTNSAGMRQILFPIETVDSEEFSVGIAHTFRSNGARQNDLAIQPTIFQSNQDTGWGNSDQDFHLGSLKSVTDVQSGYFRRNIDNRTVVNPQGPIRTIIP